MEKLKNRKVAFKDEVTEEMEKGRGDMVVTLIWWLCSMAFENGVVPEDWRSPVILPVHKGEGERTECENYRGISLFSVVGKIYAGILVDRVTEDLIDDEQESFRSGKKCVD